MPTLPFTQQMIKNMEAATHIMDGYLDAQKKNPEKMAHFTKFMKILGIQSEIFSRYGTYTKSVLHQINTQFSKEFSEAHQQEVTAYSGIVFVDFDNTILNHDLYASTYDRYQRANQKIQEKNLKITPYTFDFKLNNEFYNGVQLQGWKKIFQTLKSRNLLIVLCTARLPILGEDELFQQMIYEDLANYLDKILLIGNIGYKGYLMRYIHSILTVTYQQYFEPQSFWLIDDDLGHLESAARCGFSTIQSRPYTAQKLILGYPQQWSSPAPTYFDGIKIDVLRSVRRDSTPDFIEKLYALPNAPEVPTQQSAQLPPPSQVSPPPRRAQTQFIAASDRPEHSLIPPLPALIPKIHNASLTPP